MIIKSDPYEVVLTVEM